MNDSILFSIHPIFLFEFLFFKWYNIKDEEICDSMEKFWIKKVLYLESDWFLNFLDFSRF